MAKNYKKEQKDKGAKNTNVVIPAECVSIIEDHKVNVNISTFAGAMWDIIQKYPKVHWELKNMIRERNQMITELQQLRETQNHIKSALKQLGVKL